MDPDPHTPPPSDMPKRKAIESSESSSEEDDEENEDDEEVEVIELEDAGEKLATSASASDGASASRRKSKTARVATKNLADLYTSNKTRVTCKTCVKEGHPAKKVSGHHLSMFGVSHSTNAHADDDTHVRAVASFGSRQSKKKVLENELALRSAAQLSSKGSSMSQSTSSTTAKSMGAEQQLIDNFITNGGELRRNVELQAGRTMLALKMAPHALPNLAGLINASVLYGAKTKMVNLTLQNPKSFTEDVIEGKDGLLGQVRLELLGSHASSSTSSANSNAPNASPFWRAMSTTGVVLAMDSATDVNGHSVTPLLGMTSKAKVLIGMPHLVGSKTGAAIAAMVGPVLDGSYDVREQEERASQTKSSASVAGEILNEVANKVGPFVFMISTDHASPEQSALARLQASHAVLPCGDPSHAAHNTANYLCKPFHEEIKAIEEVVSFFRAHRIAKGKLRAAAIAVDANRGEARAISMTTLKNNIQTRFLSVFHMLLSYIRLNKALRDTVEVSTFWEWAGQEDDLKNDAAAVTATIKDSTITLKAEFLVKMLGPLLKMCRFFDAARAGSLSFVYRYWSLLSESVMAAISNPKFASIVTPSLVATLKSELIRCWKNFDFDVYTAAYFLNPYFQSTINAELRAPGMTVDGDNDAATNDAHERDSEYLAAKEQLLAVVEIMVRRFPPIVGRPARDEILGENDPSVRTTMEKVRAELDVYFSTPTMWKIWSPETEFCLSPAAVFRELNLPFLKPYAMRLLDASVGSPDIERLHWRSGRTRTKTRNLLGYVRNHALVFLDHYFNSRAPDIIDDWNECMRQLKDFEVLTDEDEAFLDAMEKRLGAMEEAEKARAADEALRGQSSTTDEVEAGGLGADAEPDEALPTARRKRQASSRFYRALAAEKARNDGE